MRGDIANFSQTLNYVLPHATKPGSETHSITRRVIRKSNGFESWPNQQSPHLQLLQGCQLLMRPFNLVSTSVF
eukprot:6477227-Amphidinium_carterae.1